jgi:hypothetical protein
MAFVYTSEGFFFGGRVIQKQWQYQMELGKIILTEKELLLMRRSNISLTDLGSSVDDYKEGYKIPLENIRKIYPMRFQKIFLVIVETRDNHIFSITLANNKDNGQHNANHLSELMSSIILKAGYSNKTSYQNDNNCAYCGARMTPQAKFCGSCGNEKK